LSDCGRVGSTNESDISSIAGGSHGEESTESGNAGELHFEGNKKKIKRIAGMLVIIKMEDLNKERSNDCAQEKTRQEILEREGC
jgi:hypothetical protein